MHAWPSARGHHEVTAVAQRAHSVRRDTVQPAVLVAMHSWPPFCSPGLCRPAPGTIGAAAVAVQCATAVQPCIVVRAAVECLGSWPACHKETRTADATAAISRDGSDDVCTLGLDVIMKSRPA